MVDAEVDEDEAGEDELLSLDLAGELLEPESLDVLEDVLDESDELLLLEVLDEDLLEPPPRLSVL